MSNEAGPAEEGRLPLTAASAVHRLDQDIVVYWRQAQGLPGAVEMIAHREQADGRGTFMLTVTPGDDLAPITQGRDWVFVLDQSGSMEGKYRSLVEGVNRGLASLNPEDRFRIVLFNKQAWEITTGFEHATAENVQHHISRLDSQLRTVAPTCMPGSNSAWIHWMPTAPAR